MERFPVESLFSDQEMFRLLAQIKDYYDRHGSIERIHWKEIHNQGWDRFTENQLKWRFEQVLKDSRAGRWTRLINENCEFVYLNEFGTHMMKPQPINSRTGKAQFADDRPGIKLLKTDLMKSSGIRRSKVQGPQGPEVWGDNHIGTNNHLEKLEKFPPKNRIWSSSKYFENKEEEDQFFNRQEFCYIPTRKATDTTRNPASERITQTPCLLNAPLLNIKSSKVGSTVRTIKPPRIPLVSTRAVSTGSSTQKKLLNPTKAPKRAFVPASKYANYDTEEHQANKSRTLDASKATGNENDIINLSSSDEEVNEVEIREGDRISLNVPNVVHVLSKNKVNVRDEENETRASLQLSKHTEKGISETSSNDSLDNDVIEIDINQVSQEASYETRTNNSPNTSANDSFFNIKNVDSDKRKKNHAHDSKHQNSFTCSSSLPNEASSSTSCFRVSVDQDSREVDPTTGYMYRVNDERQDSERIFQRQSGHSGTVRFSGNRPKNFRPAFGTRCNFEREYGSLHSTQNATLAFSRNRLLQKQPDRQEKAAPFTDLETITLLKQVKEYRDTLGKSSSIRWDVIHANGWNNYTKTQLQEKYHNFTKRAIKNKYVKLLDENNQYIHVNHLFEHRDEEAPKDPPSNQNNSTLHANAKSGPINANPDNATEESPRCEMEPEEVQFLDQMLDIFELLHPVSLKSEQIITAISKIVPGMNITRQSYTAALQYIFPKLSEAKRESIRSFKSNYRVDYSSIIQHDIGMIERYGKRNKTNSGDGRPQPSQEFRDAVRLARLAKEFPRRIIKEALVSSGGIILNEDVVTDFNAFFDRVFTDDEWRKILLQAKQEHVDLTTADTRDWRRISRHAGIKHALTFNKFGKDFAKYVVPYLGELFKDYSLTRRPIVTFKNFGRLAAIAIMFSLPVHNFDLNLTVQKMVNENKTLSDKLSVACWKCFFVQKMRKKSSSYFCCTIPQVRQAFRLVEYTLSK